MADNNTTATQTPVASTILYSDIIGQQIGYITFGFIGFVMSGLISCSLTFKSIKLRQGQHHVLLTVMEYANCTLDFTYFLTGCFRLTFVLTGQYGLFSSAWQCMLRIYTPLFIFALQFVPMILFANACERFIVVKFPMFYYHNVKTKHQVFAIVLILVYCLSATVVAFICSYFLDQTPSWSYNCFTTNAVGTKYALYYRAIAFSFTIGSGLVSLASVVAFISKRKTIGTIDNSGIPTNYSQRQKSLTKTLVLATLVVFLLMGFPATVDFFLSGLRLATPHWADLVGPYNNFIVISHSILNDIILCVMNDQVRGSVKSFTTRASSTAHDT